MSKLNLEIITLNTAGLGDYRKRRKLFNYTKKNVSQNGIIFLQETHSVKKYESAWTREFGCGKGSII